MQDPMGKNKLDELYKKHLPREDIHILVVADGEFTFGRSYYGFFELISHLVKRPKSWVQLSFYLAHRNEDQSTPPEDEWIFRLEDKFKFNDKIKVGDEEKSISFFDQIWLFGYQYDDYDLPHEEIKVIRDFMDAGGGIFATGDHEMIGKDLCGKIPRVRSMRSWHLKVPNRWKNQRNNSITPSFDILDEKDLFLFEYDAQPKEVVARKYHCYQWLHPNADPEFEIPRVGRNEIPSAFILPDRTLAHPIFSARDQREPTLNALPDHLHEGEVITLDAHKWKAIIWRAHVEHLCRQLFPNLFCEACLPQIEEILSKLMAMLQPVFEMVDAGLDLGEVANICRTFWEEHRENDAEMCHCTGKDWLDCVRNFLKSSQVYCEWPVDFMDKPLPWETIASTNNRDVSQLAQRRTLEKKPRAKEYGVVGAYEGFLTKGGVGRIVVDSTFHHWTDGNIAGWVERSQEFSPVRMVRAPILFEGFTSEEGAPHLKKIRNYQRNVAIWLTPRKKQGRMAAYALWGALIYSPLMESIDEKLTTWQLGRNTISNLAPLYGETVVRTWWTYFFEAKDLSDFFSSIQIQFHEQFLIMDDYILGGIIRKMMVLIRETLGQIEDETEQASKGHFEIKLPKLLEVDPQEILEAALKGTKSGLDLFTKNFKDYLKDQCKILKAAKMLEPMESLDKDDPF